MKKKLLSLGIALVIATTIIQPATVSASTQTKTLIDTKNVNNMTLSTYQLSGELANTKLYDHGYSMRTMPTVNLWASVSVISQFKGADGGFVYAYNLGFDSTEIILTKEDGTTLSLEKVAPLVGGVVQDEKGYYYAVTGLNNGGKKDDSNLDSSKTYDQNLNTVFITKYSESGELIKTAGFSGNFVENSTYNTQYPFEAGNCDIALNNGVLVVSYAREMYNGHQMKDVLAVNTADMSQTYNGITRKIWVSHSFDQRVIWYDKANAWLFVDHGDASPRSFVVDLLEEGNNVTRSNILSFQTNEIYNITNAQMGGIVETSKGAMFVGAAGKEGEQYVKQQLFVALLDSENAYATDVKWFQSYDILEPQIVRCGENLNAILWQETTLSTSVFCMLLDDEGNIIKDKTEFKNASLNDDEDPIFANNKIQWVTNENKGTFKYEITLESYVKITGDKEAVPSTTNFVLNNETVYLPAYTINSENYVNIRDIGALLKNKFNVVTKGNKVEIYKNTNYTTNGGELKTLGNTKKTAKLSYTEYVIGETGDIIDDMLGYKIDGVDYVKLSDIADLIGFDLTVEGNKTSINSTTEKILQTGYYYIEMLGQYVYPRYDSGWYLLKRSTTKPEIPFYIEYLGTDSEYGPKYAISYDGENMTYDSNRIEFHDDFEYLWGITLNSNSAIISDYYSPEGVLAVFKSISKVDNEKPYVRTPNFMETGNYDASVTFTKAEVNEVEVKVDTKEDIKETENNNTGTVSKEKVEVYNSGKSSVKPLVVSGKSYLPIRALIEQVLGGTVNYNGATGKIVAVANGNTFETNMDETVIYNGVTHLGLRTFSEGLGYDVVYDPTTKSILIYTK